MEEGCQFLTAVGVVWRMKMTKDELEKATGQELINARNYCGVDGYYRDYLGNVNAEMLKRFNRIAELEKENAVLKAGNPKWHKVADGDLPKENKRYLCKIKYFVGGDINYECSDHSRQGRNRHRAGNHGLY